MDIYEPEAHPPWYAPERAWAPVIWLIRAVAATLTVLLLEPLWELIIAQA